MISNFAFLIVDIYTAHSVNSFHHWAEWIPFWFSGAAAVFLLLGHSWRGPTGRSWSYQLSGYVVGWASILVGISGLLWHLQSQFFEQQTIKSLVYTAPFVAPLAYTGLGFLTLLTRMQSAVEMASGRWVIFLALSGFVGNFVLSLCDHAQNGFYHPTEWVPVIASAYGIGFLVAALFQVKERFLRVTMWILLLQILVGVWGFALHGLSNINGISSSLYENFIHGAPIFAPLLFANLALLAMLGVYDLLYAQRRRITDPRTERPA